MGVYSIRPIWGRESLRWWKATMRKSMIGNKGLLITKGLREICLGPFVAMLE